MNVAMVVAIFGRIVVTRAMSMGVAMMVTIFCLSMTETARVRMTMVAMIWLITNTTAVRMSVAVVAVLLGSRIMMLPIRMSVTVVVTMFARRCGVITTAVGIGATTRMSVVMVITIFALSTAVIMSVTKMFVAFVLLWTTSTSFVGVYFALTS